jgi:hypothetical protein
MKIVYGMKGNRMRVCKCAFILPARNSVERISRAAKFKRYKCEHEHKKVRLNTNLFAGQPENLPLIAVRNSGT